MIALKSLFVFFLNKYDLMQKLQKVDLHNFDIK